MKWIVYKLQSGALQFTVFISVVIALLLSGLILYAFTFNYFKEQSRATVGIIQLSNAGINYVLSNNEVVSDTIEIEKLTNESQKVKVQVSSWGIFNKAIAISSHRKKIFKKVAILGGFFDSERDPNLFLAETYNPLSLVGNTQIKGYVLLPSLGVRSGYIAGESYYGSQLIYGKSNESGANLPKMIPETTNKIDEYLNNPTQNDDLTYLTPNEKLFNSFKNTTKYVFSKDEILLGKVIIVGNIIVKSDKKIKISRESNLKDIIIVAPEVEIEDNVEGVFQVIASKKINIGKYCKLNYPSALILHGDADTSLNNAKDENISINTETLITGVICYFNTKNIQTDFNSNIVLEENARIKGQVYCQGNFELKGKVSGAVYTKQFVTNKAGSIFVNHIYNGIIENETIPQEFGGILFEDKTKKVIKWLY